MYDVYVNIFNKCGLDVKCVVVDLGVIGGFNLVEFMVKLEVGEDDVVFCIECDYVVNIEKVYLVLEKEEK